MRKTCQYIILLIIIAMAATSCGSVKECDEVGKEFYKCLKEGNYDQALSYLDPEATQYTQIEIWKEGLKQKNADLGMILNVERNDFESQTNDNVTRVGIKYKVKYSKATMYERLEFIERDSKYGITFYKYDEDSTMVN